MPSDMVKALEVDTRPTEQYSDISGLDKQTQELEEALVLPMTHKNRFKIILQTLIIIDGMFLDLTLVLSHPRVS